MKRIAILTINNDGNYGNRLQNYAVQEILKQQGDYLVETIYNQEGIVGINVSIYKLKNFIKKRLKRKKDCRYNCFMDFNNNIKYSKYYINEIK